MLRYAGLGVALWAFVAPASGAVRVDDARGHTLQLPAPVTRIVSLAPHVTELLYTAGAGGLLVGVSAYSDYPPAARGLPRVGDAARLDVERIVALAPQLVIGWNSGNTSAGVDQLERLGVPVYLTEPRRLQDIADLLLAFGRLADTGTTARRAAETFRRAVDKLRRRYAAGRTVSVFVQIEAQPLMTLNGRHLVSELIGLCGGRNVFADLPTLAPSVDREAVIGAAPQVILVSATLPDVEQVIENWKSLAGLPAARSGDVYAVPADQLFRATTRVLSGAQAMCEAIGRARRGGITPAATVPRHGRLRDLSDVPSRTTSRTID